MNLGIQTKIKGERNSETAKDQRDLKFSYLKQRMPLQIKLGFVLVNNLQCITKQIYLSQEHFENPIITIPVPDIKRNN